MTPMTFRLRGPYMMTLWPVLLYVLDLGLIADAVPAVADDGPGSGAALRDSAGQRPACGASRLCEASTSSRTSSDEVTGTSLLQHKTAKGKKPGCTGQPASQYEPAEKDRETAQLKLKLMNASLLFSGGAPAPTPSPSHEGSDLFGDALELPDEEHVDTKQEHGSHSKNYKSILFFFGTLTIGVTILMWLERRMPFIPYTCALFVAGILVSTVHHYKGPQSVFHWTSWFDAVELWQAIDPHTLFYIFLPALIFGEAMRLNVQMVKAVFWQVLLLACPGVLLGTFAVACVGRYVLPYGWGWPIALVFGTILSATDPVAVVALFNTLGVSPRLTMLVSGESLLNDGTAIVIFSLMLKVVLGASLTSWEMVAFFGHMTLTSVALGVTISTVAVFIIRKCAEEHYKHDMMVQVIVTICTGYLSFFLAESEFSTSGVITTVTAGFVIAYCAWPKFVTSHTMHTVWETIEFIGNTVIFFLAGVIFMDVVLDRQDHIAASDWGWLLVLYFLLTVIRALMIGVLWVPLNRFGVPITYQEGAVMVWSGLRGAVSLSLALIVDLEPGVSKKMGSRVMFHVGGIAALTFLVNAASASSVLRWLGLTQTSRSRERILQQFSSRSTKEIHEVFKSSLTESPFDGAVPSVVRAMVPTLQRDASAGNRARPPLQGGTGSRDALQDKELLKIYRQTFLRVVRHHYAQMIEKDVIPKNFDISRILLQCTEAAEVTSDEHLGDWDEIQNALDGILPKSVADAMSDLAEQRPMAWVPGIRRAFSGDSVMMEKVYGALSYREAHSHARIKVPKFFDIADSNARNLQDHVLAESQTQCRKAKAYLDALMEAQGEDYVSLGKSEMLARHLLNQQQEAVQEMLHLGIFTDAEADSLSEEAHEAVRSLANRPKSEWLAHMKRVPG